MQNVRPPLPPLLEVQLRSSKDQIHRNQYPDLTIDDQICLDLSDFDNTSLLLEMTFFLIVSPPPLSSDPCIYVKYTSMIILYVDDCIIISRNEKETNKIFQKLDKRGYKLTLLQVKLRSSKDHIHRNQYPGLTLDDQICLNLSDFDNTSLLLEMTFFLIVFPPPLSSNPCIYVKSTSMIILFVDD